MATFTAILSEHIHLSCPDSQFFCVIAGNTCIPNLFITILFPIATLVKKFHNPPFIPTHTLGEGITAVDTLLVVYTEKLYVP